jgi:hypothetical protein
MEGHLSKSPSVCDRAASELKEPSKRWIDNSINSYRIDAIVVMIDSIYLYHRCYQSYETKLTIELLKVRFEALSISNHTDRAIKGTI